MKRFIREIKEKDHVQTVFLVRDKNAGVDRNGKAFLSMSLSDATGSMNGRMFEKADLANGMFEVGDPIWVKGFVQLFQNRKQLIVSEIRKALPSEYSMAELVAELGGDPNTHLQNLMGVVGALENKFVRQLLLDTLNDGKVKELLLKAPAAKTIHHAYRGGLIEHINSIVQVMLSLKGHYPFLNKDLLVFGAIYHDLGKLFELDLADGIHYTLKGRLVGHMALACEMIVERAAAIEQFPEDLADILKHIVLSHHGKLEYGSPKLPMLPEAMVVAMIDDLDSKMNTLYHFLKGEVENVPVGEKWSHYHNGFERFFYLDEFRKTVKAP